MTDSDSLTVALPDDLAARVREAVEGGDYPDAAEVVRDALRSWAAAREVDAADLDDARLRRLVEEGEAEGGPDLDGEVVFAELRAELEATATKRERDAGRPAAARA